MYHACAEQTMALHTACIPPYAYHGNENVRSCQLYTVEAARMAWRGNGPCYPSLYQKNHLPSCPGSLHASACAGIKPRLAYMVVGVARSFLLHSGFLTYHKHMVASMAAHSGSRVFLHLKLSTNADERNSEVAQLRRAVELLQPAVVETFVESEQPYASAHREHRNQTSELAHPECFWSDVAPHFVVSQARVWWGTMARAWESVAAWEARHQQTHHRFDAVVFSRPDIMFEAGMGPWCAYQLEQTWYTTPGLLTPDMLWILPRAIAARVLTTWHVVLHCTPADTCCNLTEGCTHSKNAVCSTERRTSGKHRVSYSLWLQTYWQLEAAVRVNGTGLRGYGQLGASPHKARRNCTIHLGCRYW